MARIQGKYRCCNCGRLFDYDELEREEEGRGEFWGFPCYETLYYSPCCHDDYEEAYENNEDLIDE